MPEGTKVAFGESRSRGSETERLSIAAIIPTFRRWNLMLDTVEQLLRQTHVPDEIIIVDQTPLEEIRDEQIEQLQELKSRRTRIVYHRQSIPHVYRARNAAANVATSDLLLYLDDDVTLDRSLVEHHVAILSRNPQCDAVVGRIEREAPNTNERTAIPSDISPTRLAFSFGSYRDDQRIENIAYCVAGHLCLRRSALADVGGWDEHILTYGDKDMGLRLFKAGKRIDYDPRPTMIHLVAPRGGTRLTDLRAPWSSSQRAVSVFYVAFRHLSGSEFWRYGMVRAAHHTFLLKKNAVRPWRWLPEMAGYAKGLLMAWSWSRRGVLSSYGKSQLGGSAATGDDGASGRVPGESSSSSR